MRRILRNVLPIGILVLCATVARAQDPEMLRHFDYDRKAPLEIKHVGVQRRAQATVYDLTYARSERRGRPRLPGRAERSRPFAAIIWGHWYWENSSMRNRREFLDEAIAAGALPG